MPLPGELFNKLFLKRDIAEEPIDAENYLLDQIMTVRDEEAPQVSKLADYDSDIVKMAQIAVLFDVLNAFEE